MPRAPRGNWSCRGVTAPNPPRPCAPALRGGPAGPLHQLTWQAVTVLFHSTILSGCRITSWYTSSAGQGRKVCAGRPEGWAGPHVPGHSRPSLLVGRNPREPLGPLPKPQSSRLQGPRNTCFPRSPSG